MLAGDPKSFLDLWEQSEDVTLMLSLGEKEKGIKSVGKICEQVSSVLGSSPAKIQVEPHEYQVHRNGNLAYAVILERSISTMDGRKAESANRSTLIFSLKEKHWKVVHVHNDNITPTQETLSYILRHKNLV